ncbi:MAG: DUF2330 domain-containing protein [Candidatus Paceibacterota bacterium]
MVMIWLIPNIVSADGGLVYRPEHKVLEADQKAIIAFENGVEHLILSVEYEGNADDFGWIVPVPSKPTLDSVRKDIFDCVEGMIDKPYVEEYYPPVLGNLEGIGSSTNKYVNVIESKVMGDLKTEVIDTNDKQLFFDWLNKNGYQYPTAKIDILDHYIDNHWYFVLSKVNAVENNSNTQPIKISFATPQIVYPMMISQLSLPETETSKEKMLMYNYLRLNPKVMNLSLFIISPQAQRDTNLSVGVHAKGKIDRWYIGYLIGENMGLFGKIYLTQLTGEIDKYKMSDDWFFANYDGLDTGNVTSNLFLINYRYFLKWYDQTNHSSIIGGIIWIVVMLVLSKITMVNLRKTKSKFRFVIWLIFVGEILFLIYTSIILVRVLFNAL